MPLPETFGYYGHMIVDSRPSLAFAGIAAAVSEFSVQKLNKMVRKRGAAVVYDELGIRWPGDERYRNGAWEVMVVDESFSIVANVRQSDNYESLLVPDISKSTAVEIAQVIARSLEETATKFQELLAVTTQWDEIMEADRAPFEFRDCLDGLEFQLNDGTKLPNLVIVDNMSYFARRRDVISRRP